MTKEEQIEMLKEEYEDCAGDDSYTQEWLETLNSAIKALEQEPTTKNDLGVDCISRKAALDITWHDPSYSDPLNVLTEVRDKIRELPSVTPQEPILDKIRTEIMQLDCDTDYIDYDYNDMAQTEEVHMICREEVLQIIDKYKAESEG